MTTPVNITPTAGSDGVPYSVAVPITQSEADLNGGSGSVSGPIQIEAGEAILATVLLSANGLIVGNNTYVVMQVDMGDNQWVDVCWCVWNGNQGSALFVFSNGIAGANVFQQSRAAGQPPNPQASGSNQMVLGGRIRFVGKSAFVGGSSSLAGVSTAVLATIRYRLLRLR